MPRLVRLDGRGLAGLVLEPGEREGVDLVVRDQHRHELDGRERGALGPLAEEGRGAHDELRAAVAQHVLDLLGLEQRVDRHDDAAERKHGVVDAREVGDVGNEHRNRVAGTDASRLQCPRVLARLAPEVTVGRLLRSDDDGDRVGKPSGALGENCGDGHRGETSAHAC